MKKFSILLVAFVCAFACMLTGCKDKKDVVRISEVTHSIFYAPLYVAINQGYFAEEGIEIELTNAGGSNTVMTSIISNSADIGLMGPESVAYVRNNGMTNAPIIFAQLTACDGSFLVGRNANEVNNFSWENLAGSHIIAGRKGGMPAMTLQYILEDHNIVCYKNPDEVQPDGVYFDTSIEFSLTSSSFVAGTGDYCTMFDPTASQCVENGTGYIVSALGDEVSDVPYTCFVASQNYLNKNEKKLNGFMRALKKGYNYLMNATDEQIINSLKPSFSTTSDSLILASVKNYKRIGAYASSFVLKESSWNFMLDIIDNAGELTSRVAWNDAVNTTFANNVA